MNDYDLRTPKTNEGREYECCEMKIAALVSLGCIMAIILAIFLVWFVRRKWQTKQYTITQKRPEILLSQN